MTFTQILNAIRNEKAMQVRDSAAGNAGEIDRVERCFACRQRIQETVDRCHRAFAEVAPQFFVAKSLYDGNYVLSSVADEDSVAANSRRGHSFSRIAFFLSPRAADGRFDVQCKLTVRCHERGSASLSVSFDDRKMDAFRRFVEDQFCRFAKAYFHDIGGCPATADEA